MSQFTIPTLIGADRYYDAATEAGRIIVREVMAERGIKLIEDTGVPSPIRGFKRIDVHAPPEEVGNRWRKAAHEAADEIAAICEGHGGCEVQWRVSNIRDCCINCYGDHPTLLWQIIPQPHAMAI